MMSAQKSEGWARENAPHLRRQTVYIFCGERRQTVQKFRGLYIWKAPFTRSGPILPYSPNFTEWKICFTLLLMWKENVLTITCFTTHARWLVDRFGTSYSMATPLLCQSQVLTRVRCWYVSKVRLVNKICSSSWFFFVMGALYLTCRVLWLWANPTIPQRHLPHLGHPSKASVPLVSAFLSPHWKLEKREETALGIFFNKWPPPQNECALSVVPRSTWYTSYHIMNSKLMNFTLVFVNLVITNSYLITTESAQIESYLGEPLVLSRSQPN